MDLILYDGACGLCRASVLFVLKRDKKKRFLFAPLQGVTAKKILPFPISEDSVVVVEEFDTAAPRLTFSGKGACKILWLLGGLWSLPGLLYFLPGALLNPVYRFIAGKRHLFFNAPSCEIPPHMDSSRFLP